MLLVARQSLILAAKDMRLLARDRFGLAFALLLPLLFIAGFTLAMSGIGPADERLRLAIATEERGGFSRDIIDALGDGGLEATEWDAAEARAAAERGELPGFVLLPSDFTQRAMSGSGARALVVVAGEDEEHRAALLGLAQGIAGRVQTYSLAAQGAVALEGLGALNIAALEELAAQPPLASLEFEQVGEAAPLNVADFALPGYLTMFVFMAAALGAEAIARERQTQTLERLIANGVRRSSIVVGKMVGGVYRGLMQLAVLWAAGILVFSIELGRWPAVVIGVSLALVLASAAFGVMLASLVRTVRSASSVAVLASLTLAPLGGSWWPLFIAPEWLQVLGKITPHGWANDAFNKLMLFGAKPEDVLPHIGALAAFALVFLVVALAQFRRGAAVAP